MLQSWPSLSPVLPTPHPYHVLPLQAQSLTAADIVNMSVMCREGDRWRTLMTQDFKPFENRE